MGLAASQARLLTITARLADNELRSQTINNAKMRLATQSSQASEDYISALNNATMKFSNYDDTGLGVSQDLTYNALTAYSSYNTQYGLSNSSGQILVSEEEAALFIQANGDVNAYLKSHGLEYTTTYFDQIGNIQNEAYPSPFNNIDPETLQSYYEGYGSYEASVEKQNYESNYKNFVSAENSLNKAANLIIPNYLTTTTNKDGGATVGPIIYSSSSSEYAISHFSGIYTSSISSIYNDIKNRFLGNNNYTYNVQNLLNNGFISSNTADNIKEFFNSITVDNTNQITYYSDTTFDVPTTTNSDGSKTYILDDYINITVDSAGNVVGCYSTETASDGESLVLTGDAKADGSTSLLNYVNQLGVSYTYKDDDGNTGTENIKYSLKKDADGNYTAKTGYQMNDLDTFKESGANEIVNQVMTLITKGLNQENFADFLVEQGATNLANNYGIDVNSNIGDTGKTIAEILEDYKDSKYNFISLIFDANSVSTVESDLKSGYSFTDDDGETREVNAENLRDIDFVLQYIKNRGLQQSNSYNTLIKENIVENVIEEYGEPKYAWVDENDTSNTGNADAKAQWYTNLFTRMQQGYKALENGLASSKEWIEYALESGIVTLEQVDTTYRWNTLDYKSCTRITEETDDTAVTKAEAEYNRAMNDIEAKDNIYDIELKNIDTEHTSLQTEYDVIKDVMKKNVERTFKFNQSA